MYTFRSLLYVNVHRFLKVMVRGFPEYGCTVNDKTQTNVPLQQGPPCTEVAYCGYMINTMLLHITGDYARYMFQDIAHSMRLSEVKHPGKWVYNARVHKANSWTFLGQSAVKTFSMIYLITMWILNFMLT